MALVKRKTGRRARALLALPVLTALTALPAPARAAVELPARNPQASVSQDVGLTRVEVRYARTPGQPPAESRAPLRGRDDPAARLAISRDVILAGTPVPAGEYALGLIPSSKEWTLVLYRDPDVVESSRSPHPELEQARVKVAAAAGPAHDRLTVVFSDVTTEKASLDLEWSGVRVPVPIAANTRAQILSEIRALDDAGRRYAQLARHLAENKGERAASLAYARQAVALDDTPENRALEASLLGARAERPVAAPPARERSPGALEIAPVVKRGRHDIESCYQRALRRDPGLTRGRIDLSISVAPSGRVKSVDVEAPTGLAAMEPCVKSAVSRWAFPPSSADYVTQLPLGLRGDL